MPELKPVNSLLMSLILFVHLFMIMPVNSEPEQNYLMPVEFDVDFEIKLENLFYSPVSEVEINALNENTKSVLPDINIKLVGTLLSTTRKLAWIKTTDNNVLEVPQGQVIPGSTLKIDQIYSDSIDLVQNIVCQSKGVCESKIRLDINQQHHQ